MSAAPHARGLYFEEFEIGRQIVTAGRTITETDIVQFAGLSGDFNQIHTDAEFAAETVFGRRVSHGLLVLSIVSGLAVQTGFMEGTIMAFREVEGWKFSRPVFIGDTVHVILEVTGLKALPRLGGGALTLKLTVMNQHNETVQSGTWTVLIASQPE
ncbi:MAG TPA: MaoC/PaaZ C-terminal domain-containing protein [Anaerolineales bacterium]|nr:MaoC/PaaZ C-terminal domain-containing protein [Anaerolineales bacterium]